MTIRFLTVFALGVTTLTTPVWANKTIYPLTIENCGTAISFDAPPENVVSIGQAGTEILYALKLGPNMAGTALWYTKVLPEFKAQDDQVQRIDDNMPSFESVIAKRPQLALTQYEWMIGPQGAVGTRPQFHEFGINTYILPTDCEGKNNLIGSDGTRTEAFDPELIHKTITQLGQIFDRQDDAERLNMQLAARETAALDRARALEIEDMTAAIWFSSADLELDPYIAGRSGVAGSMLTQIGLTNIVTSDEEWPTVGWETIARANPTWLVLARMERRRFAADDLENKLAFLASDPVASQMEAVRKGRIIILDADEMEAGIRRVQGIEKLVSGIAAAAN